MPKTSKKPAAKSASTRLNKSAWIRSQPASMPAKDVVAKGKSEQIQLSLAQVYTARSNAKKHTPKGKPGRKPGAVVARTTVSGTDELAFRRIVLALGINKAESMLKDLKHSVGL